MCIRDRRRREGKYRSAAMKARSIPGQKNRAWPHHPSVRFGRRSALVEGVKSRKRGSAGTRHVEIWDEGERRHLKLLLAERCVLADPFHEPLAELRGGLDDAPSYEVGARIDEVA